MGGGAAAFAGTAPLMNPVGELAPLIRNGLRSGGGDGRELASNRCYQASPGLYQAGVLAVDGGWPMRRLPGLGKKVSFARALAGMFAARSRNSAALLMLRYLPTTTPTSSPSETDGEDVGPCDYVPPVSGGGRLFAMLGFVMDGASVLLR